MNKLLSAIAIGLCISFNANSQQIEVMNHQQLVDNTDGIYQIQMINNRYKPSLNDEHLRLILASQSQSDIVFLDLSEKVRIKIQSKDAVISNGMIPTDEKIVYINN